MRFHLPSLYLSTILLLTSPLTTATATPQSLTFHLPASFPSTPLPLSPQTTLTLTTTGHDISTPITASGTFRFPLHSLPPGSYLAQVASREWTFAPLRIDISATGEPGGAKTVQHTLTFPGHPWANTGARLSGYQIELVPIKPAEYYIPREGFSPMKLLGSPMILIAVVSLGAMYFVPKLIDNMDPDLKAEFEEAQKKTLAGQAGFGGAGRNPVEGFDLAGFLSGSGGSKQAGAGTGEGSGKGGKKK